MAYIGNIPAEAYTSIAKQTITGNGGASYTLDHAVANENEIEVFVNNVRQEPSIAYTVSGTALTMTGNVEASDDFYVVFQGKAIQTTSHPEGQDLKARDGTFTGTVTSDGLVMGDNDKAQFGASNDLQIYHDGSNSYIDDSGTGNLKIRGANVNIEKYTGETMAEFIADGETNLRYNHSLKLKTTSTGVDVTGQMLADTIRTNTTGSASSPSIQIENDTGFLTLVQVILEWQLMELRLLSLKIMAE